MIATTMPHILKKSGPKFVRSVVRNRLNQFEKRRFEKNSLKVLRSHFSGKCALTNYWQLIHQRNPFAILFIVI